MANTGSSIVRDASLAFVLVRASGADGEGWLPV